VLHKSNSGAKTDEEARLVAIRRAVRDLRALQQEIGERKGFMPLSDEEIKDAINEG
jgi:hypothetical protein